MGHPALLFYVSKNHPPPNKYIHPKLEQLLSNDRASFEV